MISILFAKLKKILRSWHLKIYKYKQFGDNYVEGKNSISDLSRILIHKTSSGNIILGNNVICSAELYSFFGKGNIHIGDCSYIGQNSRIWALKGVTIGERVLISHNVFIVDNLTHPLNASIRHQQYMAKHGFPFPQNIDLQEKEVIIEDDVWIAANAIILSGVRIGKGAIVGAGSVVTKSIAAGDIVGGNPARVLKNKSLILQK
jgi:acetyltransferase-like isoleucine patch superfamily enzyme